MKEVVRPWGYFDELALNKECTVKVISLKPRQELSLQRHKKRREMWYFLTPGKVQVGEKKFRVKRKDVVNIPKNVKHRVFSGKNKVEFVEVSFGKFEEIDEVRLEDKYGRE